MASVAGVLEVLFLPQFLEISGVVGGEGGRFDLNDVVLHEGEGVVGEVERAGPDGGAVAHDEFVMHQFHPGDAPPGIAERLHLRAGPGRGRILTGGEIGRERFIAIVANADGDASGGALVQRGRELLLEGVAQTHVVDSEIKAGAGRLDKGNKSVHYRGGFLFVLREKEEGKRIGRRGRFVHIKRRMRTIVRRATAKSFLNRAAER